MASKAKKGGGDVLQQKSPAEFFAENKNIAGFDNVRLLAASLALRRPAKQSARRRTTQALPPSFLLRPLPCPRCSPASACTPPSASWWRMGWTQRRASASCQRSASLCELLRSGQLLRMAGWCHWILGVAQAGQRCQDPFMRQWEAMAGTGALRLLMHPCTTLASPCREEYSQARLNRLRGVENHVRRDAELYHDFETDDARTVRPGVAKLLITAL